MSCACANPATGLGLARFPEPTLTFSRHALTKLDRALLQAYVCHILGVAWPILFPHISRVCRHVPLFLLHLVHYCLSPLHVRELEVISLATASDGEHQTSKNCSARSSLLACAEEVSRTSEQRSHKYRKPQKVFPRSSDGKEDQNKTKTARFSKERPNIS